MKKHKRTLRRASLLPALAGSILLLISVSCKTTPDYISAERLVYLLPDDAVLLGKLDASSNPVILKTLAALLLSLEGDMDQILGRTERVFFAVNSGIENEQVFSLVIQGKFPKGLTQTLVQSDKNWQKKKGEIPWWENDVFGLQLAVPEAGLVMISGGLIEEMLQNFKVTVPKKIVYEALKEFEVSDMVLYISDPGSGFLKGLPVDPEKFPLRSLWFTLGKGNDGNYMMGGVFSLVDEKKAKIMATLSKIVVVGWLRANRLGSMEDMKDTLDIKPEGASVRLSGISLDGDSVTRLIISLLPAEGIINQEETKEK